MQRAFVVIPGFSLVVVSARSLRKFGGRHPKIPWAGRSACFTGFNSRRFAIGE